MIRKEHGLLKVCTYSVSFRFYGYEGKKPGTEFTNSLFKKLTTFYGLLYRLLSIHINSASCPYSFLCDELPSFRIQS